MFGGSRQRHWVKIGGIRKRKTRLILLYRAGKYCVPCRIRAPIPNQKLLSKVKLFCIRVEDGLHGCGLYHSYGVNLEDSKRIERKKEKKKKRNLNLWWMCCSSSWHWRTPVMHFTLLQASSFFTATHSSPCFAFWFTQQINFSYRLLGAVCLQGFYTLYESEVKTKLAITPRYLL